MTASVFRFALALPFVLAGEAWAQGTTRITEEPVVLQPPPFSTTGKTVVVPRTRIEIDEGGKRLKGDARRGKEVRPESEAEPEAASDPACRGSKILCGDPLRRKKKKSEGE